MMDEMERCARIIYDEVEDAYRVEVYDNESDTWELESMYPFKSAVLGIDKDGRNIYSEPTYLPGSIVRKILSLLNTGYQINPIIK